MNQKFLLPLLSFVIIFSCTLPVSASGLDDQDAYHEWLKRYGAMDIYAMSVKERESGPEGQIDYADALVALGNPEAALSELRSVDTGGDPLLEGKRHWVRHRALRQIAEFDQAVLAVIEASGYLGMNNTARLMKKETGLDILWSNVWKRWFFHTLCPGRINDGRKIIMEQSVVLARSAWPDNKLWDRIELEYSYHRPSTASPSSDQIQAARALALWSIADWPRARQALSGIQDSDTRLFFDNLGRFLETSSPDTWENINKTRKSAGFTDVFAHHLQNYAIERFRLSSPMVGSWDDFLDRIKGLSPEKALQNIRQELSSALLSDEIRGRLESLAFIYELQQGPLQKAIDSLENASAKTPDLPFTLNLAASLVTQDYTPLAGQPPSRYPFLKEILNAAGFNPDQNKLSQFWKKEHENISRLYSQFPLDYSINYLYFSQSFRVDQDQSSARNLAFLFPHSEIGQSAFLALAQHAYNDGNKALAWRYLQNISQEFAEGPRQLELLEAKAGILMDMGRDEESLSTYQIILEKEPQRLGPERRLKLALLAQEKNQWGLGQEMLEGLWQERSSLPDAIQAEVLFWLGEGSQHQGDMEQALDYYLRLSWQFPGEHIWAVTAMYRAGLIYEQRGMLSTAKNLFQTVLKNADRDSQKEAARQRINSIEARMGTSTDRDTFLF